MRVINEKPPVYDKIVAAGMKPSNKTVFTYGDAIYNPHKLTLTADVVAHEEVHERQQGKDPEAWWDRCIADKAFQAEQEAEGYAAQYDLICKGVRDRNQRARIRYEVATILSGPIYGNRIGHNEAMDLLKKYSKTK